MPLNIARTAGLLGAAGLIPFILPLATFVTGWHRPLSLTAFEAYSAVILSFLGGIRWGAAVHLEQDARRELLIAVSASLWAFLALAWPDARVSLALLTAGFVAMGLADGLRPGPTVPDWMTRLRVRLSIAVVALHVVTGVVLSW